MTSRVVQRWVRRAALRANGHSGSVQTMDCAAGFSWRDSRREVGSRKDGALGVTSCLDGWWEAPSSDGVEGMCRSYPRCEALGSRDAALLASASALASTHCLHLHSAVFTTTCILHRGRSLTLRANRQPALRLTYLFLHAVRPRHPNLPRHMRARHSAGFASLAQPRQTCSDHLSS